MADYFENGVFAEGKAAWHGAGVVDPRDGLTIDDVLDMVPELASRVDKQPLLAEVGDHIMPVPNMFATVRELDRKPLGVVTSRYRVLQNRDAYGFLADIVDADEASIVTAGTLHGGAQLWFLARLPGSVTVDGVDTEEMQTYMLISNSHDGKSAVRCAIVHIRVVCANTLAAAFTGATSHYSIRHTDAIEGRIIAARSALGLAFESRDGMVAEAVELLDVTVTDADIHRWLDGFLPVPNEDHATHNSIVRHRTGIEGALHDTPDLAGIKGTAWGLVQATSQYTDHRMPRRGSATHTREENRFRDVTSGASLTSRGLIAARRAFLTPA